MNVFTMISLKKKISFIFPVFCINEHDIKRFISKLSFLIPKLLKQMIYYKSKSSVRNSNLEYRLKSRLTSIKID